jgi:hypothetical protein
MRKLAVLSTLQLSRDVEAAAAAGRAQEPTAGPWGLAGMFGAASQMLTRATSSFIEQVCPGGDAVRSAWE